MFRIPLSSDHVFLTLAPRWAGWGEAGQAAALGALYLVPLALCVGLYRYQLLLVSRRAAAAILSLRCLGLLTLWTLVGLQPTIAYIERNETPSRVLVAVDLSESMKLADPQRAEQERTRLAAVLRLTPAAVDALSRHEVVRQILGDESSGLLLRLQAQHHVELVGFHRTLWDGSTQTPAALFQFGERPAGATGTDLTVPLARAQQHGNPQLGKLLGVVLLTDGQHNQGSTPLESAKELARQRIPIYPVGIGSKVPPVDLAVVDVQAPKQIYKDAEANVEAKIRASGLPAQDLIVELHGSGKFVKQEKIIKHDGKDRIYTTTFSIKLSEVGAQSLEVRAHPQNSQTKELTTDNNRLATVTRVAPEKTRVLVIEDEPRWEYHYLTTTLGRDTDLTVERILFSPPRLDLIPQDKLEKMGFARRQFPLHDVKAEDPLWQYDCIVLGDVAPEQLPVPERQRLERYVADRGGTLVVIAGRRHMPMAFLTGPTEDPFVKLLPLRRPKLMQLKDGFAFSVTELGMKTPFLQIEKDVASSRQRWLDMPKHFWAVGGEAKPGAVVLARAESSALLKTKDTAADATGLLLQQPYGFGKVVYVGIESTWRLRYRVGDLYHHRFWGQMMRWAASDPWLPEGNRFVRFGAKAPIYRHDQEVELAARLGEETPAIAAATARIKLLRKEGAKETSVTSAPLVQDEQRPKQWHGKIKQLAPGQYRLELDIPELRSQLAEVDPGAKPSAVHGFTVLPPEDSEMIDVATDWGLLRALAEQTQGRLFTTDDVDQLPDLLRPKLERQETRRDDAVWRQEPMVWWILGLLLALLTVEWIIRKFAGLP